MKYSDINWQKCHNEVIKLQRKIIVAWVNKNMKLVHDLQESLIKKFEARALAVRKVTTNTGAKTPGQDGKTISSDLEKLEMIQKLKSLQNYKASPVKRVMIPKANGGERSLGIPSIFDRCVQALYLQALEPIAETTGDERSYGFRRYRSTQDVQQYIKAVLSKESSARFILDVDIKGFFDNISHEWILKNIPINKYILKQWLNSGYFFNKELLQTIVGVPQGGIISPAIANMVLDGLEKVIDSVSKGIEKKIKADLRKSKQKPIYNPKIHYPPLPPLPEGGGGGRYADDFLITADKREFFDLIMPKVEKFLAERGVELNKEKTKIYTIEEGFNFVGFNFKKNKTTARAKGEIFITIPTKENVQNLKDKIKETFKKFKDPIALIGAINPILRGWGNYYKYSNASKIFSKLDHYVFQKTLHWIRSRKRGRGMKNAIKEFYKKIGRRNWNFQYTKQRKSYKLFSLASVKIHRYIMVKSLNPFVLENYNYFESRTLNQWYKSISDFKLKLLSKQKGQCPVCKESLKLLNEEELEVHHIQPREYLGNQAIKNLLLLHKTCHQSVTNCTDPNLLAKYTSEGIIKPLSKRYKNILAKSNKKPKE